MWDVPFQQCLDLVCSATLPRLAFLWQMFSEGSREPALDIYALVFHVCHLVNYWKMIVQPKGRQSKSNQNHSPRQRTRQIPAPNSKFRHGANIFWLHRITQSFMDELFSSFYILSIFLSFACLCWLISKSFKNEGLYWYNTLKNVKTYVCIANKFYLIKYVTLC